MIFGFPPKYVKNITVPELSDKQLFIIAIETIEELKWNINTLSETGCVAITKFSLSSWSEEITVNINNGTIYLKSSCIESQLIDWGKNKKNITRFISTFNKIKEELSLAEIEAKIVKLENSLKAAVSIY
ncbi:hypothetical protein [Aquimarina longa]|uniref:hypothetical protein n=1 Tax=Aquimarina longa TaxID=1080221 RepID=UPI0007825B64|nr:hypothetical protein [Aquimarina longa]